MMGGGAPGRPAVFLRPPCLPALGFSALSVGARGIFPASFPRRFRFFLAPPVPWRRPSGRHDHESAPSAPSASVFLHFPSPRVLGGAFRRSVAVSPASSSLFFHRPGRGRSALCFLSPFPPSFPRVFPRCPAAPASSPAVPPAPPCFHFPRRPSVFPYPASAE